MTLPVYNRTLALAGLYQSVDLVVQFAWNGRVETESYEACIGSLFKLNPANYEEVYGGITGITGGLKILRNTLNKQRDAHALERTRYSVMLIFLEKKLSKNPDKIEVLRSGIHSAEAQLEHFDPTHINVISNLADIYRTSVSELGPKIMVRGEQTILSHPDNAARIRAMLLAGIRAVILWRQAGGNRWRLFIERNAVLREINKLLVMQ